MQKSVYVETSLPSFYYETRIDLQSVFWRKITRLWWKKYRKYYTTVSSDFVRLELEEGQHPNKAKKLLLLQDVEMLDHVPIIDDIIELYIKNKVVPADAGGDAYHLASASYYGVDFLLTWNCAHLANPNKFRHISVINSRLQLNTPVLCTPEQLLMDYEGENQ